MTAAETYRLLLARGVHLSSRDGRLRYEGPERALTPEVLDHLRSAKNQLLDHLAALERRAERFRRWSIAELVGHLAAEGYYFRVRAGGLQLRAHPAADPVEADDAVVHALLDRRDDVVAWLGTPAVDLADEDLNSLGFTREAVERYAAEGRANPGGEG